MHLTKSKMTWRISPSQCQCTVMPRKDITFGEVQPSTQMCRRPPRVYRSVAVSDESCIKQEGDGRTAKRVISPTFMSRWRTLTSRETVAREGMCTRGYSIRKTSLISGSSTIAYGRWRRAHQSARSRHIRSAVYVMP